MSIDRLRRVKSARRGSPCNVIGCYKPATRASGYCAKHDHYNRRNGHPEQTFITLTQLTPLMKWLDKLIRTSGKAEGIKVALHRNIKTLGAEAEAEIKAWQDGKVRHLPTMRAWEIIAEVASQPDTYRTSLITLAILIMAQRDARAFKSQRAVLFTLARRWRAMTDTDVGVWWDQKEQRTKRCRRDPKPQTMEIAGNLILGIFKKPAAQLLTYIQRLEAEQAEADGVFKFLYEGDNQTQGAEVRA